MRAPEVFELEVQRALVERGITALHTGASSGSSDVTVERDGRQAAIEVKYLRNSGANLVSARFRYADGVWVPAGEESGFTRMVIDELNSRPEPALFVEDVRRFVEARRLSLGQPVPPSIAMPATGEDADVLARDPRFVTPGEMRAFMGERKRAGGNRYVFLDPSCSRIPQLVEGHYRKKGAQYLQYGDDFFVIGDQDPLGLNDAADPPVPRFDAACGRIGLRVSSRTRRYEIIPEVKAAGVPSSPYGIVGRGRSFPPFD